LCGAVEEIAVEFYNIAHKRAGGWVWNPSAE
jgi:hypothetical protein